MGGLPTTHTSEEAASAAMVEAAQSLEEREGIDYEGFDDPATQQSEACEGGLAGARAAALWHLSRDPTCRYPYIHHMYKHVHPYNQKYIQCTTYHGINNLYAP